MSVIGATSRCGGERLSFAPLETMVRQRLEHEVLGGQLVGASVRRQAVLLRTRRRQIYRWRHYGLTWAQADVLAVRCGYHPAEVWEAWYEVTASSSEEVLDA